MAISIDLGSGAGSTNGDTLYDAFTKINTFLSSTTKEVNGDLNINGIRVGRGGSSVQRNTAVGNSTLTANTTGFSNTAMGVGALLFNTDASFNTAVGSDSLFSNTTGTSNCALGVNALQKNINGSNNSAFGANALFNNTSANFNSAVGSSALLNNTTGTHNTSIGYASLLNNASGSNNTAIGREALNAVSSFNNVSGLGYNAQVSASNQVQLGDASTNTFVYGTVQNRSDLRDKTEVRDTILGLDFISKLRAVDYKWDMRDDYKAEMPIQGELSDEEYKILLDEWLESCKLDNITHDGTHKRSRFHHGLIAQELQEVITETGIDFGGFQDHSINGGYDVLSIGYDELIAPMIKAIQELKAEIELLKSK